MVPPGTGATDDQIKEFAQSIAPLIVLSIGEVAAVKRFIFEAQTALIGHSCYRPLKGPPGAKSNLGLTGPLEVAHSVYDLFAGMLEQGQLKYVHPCKRITPNKLEQSNHRKRFDWTRPRTHWWLKKRRRIKIAVPPPTWKCGKP